MEIIMSEHWLSRAELLIGEAGLQRLRKAVVTVVGLGGVGSFAVESLARAGVGHFQLVDYDRVAVTNINRQIIALHSTVGRAKTEVMQERILDINPEAEVRIYSEFLCKENRLAIMQKSDYIVDAIDSIGPKMGMIKDLCTLEIPFISVLGAGNRLDPTSIKIVSIWETHGCPLAKRLKKLLRRNGVTRDFQVVFSAEKPLEIDVFAISANASLAGGVLRPNSIPKSLVGSISYMPAIMGMMAGGKVVRELISGVRLQVSGDR